MKFLLIFTFLSNIIFVLGQNETTTISNISNNQSTTLAAPTESSTYIDIEIITKQPQITDTPSSDSQQNYTTEIISSTKINNNTGTSEGEEENLDGLVWGAGPIIISIIIVAIFVIGLAVFLKEKSDRKLKNEFPPLLQSRNFDSDLE
ncbi:hypothetical protein PVAND_014608 [Polypedilum vanderplanki]|uniref:Uncharacterized protein n=1 Tax=Polypedilum vanderplanki TaxID=319348 RepID=A0A9J6BAF4_POLVA|nr:hypothetical protein PVAND_014608 [Polypedilum vanderplanki]